jgi:hypothetical protein
MASITMHLCLSLRFLLSYIFRAVLTMTGK